MNAFRKRVIVASGAIAAMLAVVGCGGASSASRSDSELTAHQKTLVTDAVMTSKKIGELVGLREAVADDHKIDRRLTHISEALSWNAARTEVVALMNFIDARIRAHTAQVKAHADAGIVAGQTPSVVTGKQRMATRHPHSVHHPEAVSPACETVREELREEEGSSPTGDGAYLAEDRELVQEECKSAAAHRRWSEIKHEMTPQGQAEKAGEEQELDEHPSRAEVEEAERIAGELRGQGH